MFDVANHCLRPCIHFQYQIIFQPQGATAHVALRQYVFCDAEMTPQEQVYLLMLLNIWDANEKGLTFHQVLRAMEIGTVRRTQVPQYSSHQCDEQQNGTEHLMKERNSSLSARREDLHALESKVEEVKKREDALRMQVKRSYQTYPF